MISPEVKDIDIGQDFSRFPGGRVRTDGPYSGQAFREDYLIPALLSFKYVNVKIDGAMGYGSSFLEECFGGLVRGGISGSDLLQRIRIVYEDQAFGFYEDEIWQYVNDAAGQ